MEEIYEKPFQVKTLIVFILSNRNITVLKPYSPKFHVFIYAIHLYCLSQCFANINFDNTMFNEVKKFRGIAMIYNTDNTKLL